MSNEMINPIVITVAIEVTVWHSGSSAKELRRRLPSHRLPILFTHAATDKLPAFLLFKAPIDFLRRERGVQVLVSWSVLEPLAVRDPQSGEVLGAFFA